MDHRSRPCGRPVDGHPASLQPIAQMVHWVRDVDHHPPLCYILLRGWAGILGTGEGAARALSAACGTCTIPALYLLGRRLFSSRIGLMSASILAVLPRHVRLEQEARLVTLPTLRACWVLFAFVKLRAIRSGIGSEGTGSLRAAEQWVPEVLTASFESMERWAFKGLEVCLYKGDVPEGARRRTRQLAERGSPLCFAGESPCIDDVPVAFGGPGVQRDTLGQPRRAGAGA